MALHPPFYDPLKSYEENYNKGPFGAFTDGTVFEYKKEPVHEFLGHMVNLPFGIPAGPVLNSAFVKGAFDKGFDLVVYKTVRSDSYPCHPWPNVLAVHPRKPLMTVKNNEPLVGDTTYDDPISITNSFGVPSKPAKTWQEDVKQAIFYERKGQVLILSFMGMTKPNQTQQELVDDFARAAELSLQTDAKILEVNLSCPNIGNEGLVCYNLDVTQQALKAIRAVIGKTPLIVKTGFFEEEGRLKEFAEICDTYAEAIAAINTMPAPIVNEKGEQALPGSPARKTSGVCGAAIKQAGWQMTKRLADLKKANKISCSLIGVGGVTSPADYEKYRTTGADAVMSATGAMWNPFLAQEIKKQRPE